MLEHWEGTTIIVLIVFIPVKDQYANSNSSCVVHEWETGTYKIQFSLRKQIHIHIEKKKLTKRIELCD